METENTEFVDSGEVEIEGIASQVIEFSINDAAIAEVAEDFKDVDAHKDLAVAKAAKKTLTKMRTTLADAHREAKADALAYGRRCDTEKNRLLDLIAAIEDPITEQLDDIKNAEAREEQQRQDKIMEGIEQIQAFALDRHDLTFEQLNERLDTLLALKVDPDFYAEHTVDAENAKEVAESKLRIAIIAEDARLKELAEKEELELENKKLREDAAKRDAAQAEKDAAQKVIDDEAAAKLAKENAERQAELDKQAEEQAAAQKVLDDEAAAKLHKEEEEQAAAIAALQAPDKDKLRQYSDAIHHLIGLKPVLQSDAGNEVLLATVSALITVRETLDVNVERIQ